MGDAVGRHDLTDEAWAVVEALLPVAVCGRPARNLRRQVDGIRHRVRAGCPWRDVPERFGPWSSLYRVFRRYQREGVWDQVLDALWTLADGGRQICWEVSVDSTIARAHQHAAGARRDSAGQKEPPGAEPADHGLGRSRGGWTTKIHAACEQGQKLMGMVVTAGQRGDSPQFAAVLDQVRVKRPGGAGRPRTRPDRVRADKGYASAANRRRLRRRGIAATIPDKKDHRANRLARGSKGGRPPKVDYEDYKKRHAVECMFNRSALRCTHPSPAPSPTPQLPVGLDQGNGAYLGMQSNGGSSRVLLFSVRDVSEATAGSTGSWCQSFGGEGVGMSCR